MVVVHGQNRQNQRKDEEYRPEEQPRRTVPVVTRTRPPVCALPGRPIQNKQCPPFCDGHWLGQLRWLHSHLIAVS